MQVRTLFFAAYRDAVGTSTLELELPDGATDADLAIGQLYAARGATLGAPLVEGRAGDAQLVAELRDG